MKSVRVATVEEELFILLGLAIVTALVLGVAGFILAIRQNTRIKKLDSLLVSLKDQVFALEEGSAPQTTHTTEPPIRQSQKPTPDAAPTREGPWVKAKAEAAAERAVAETQPDTIISETVDKTGAPPPPPTSEPPAPKGPGFFARIVASFKANWVIWIAGLALAMGGIFIVQYGIEAGLIGPTARVALSLLFGAALLGGAEKLRRLPSHDQSQVFSVPAALAAGGIASMFGGVVSAHVMYQLTDALFGFISMAIVSWLALAAGLIYGPVLAVIGLLGAFLSPLLLSVDAPPSPLMYVYFALVLAASLFVERWQRWIWLSSLAVGLALFWAPTLQSSLPDMPYSPIYLMVVAIAAITIPAFGAPPSWADNRIINHRSLFDISSTYPTLLALVTSIVSAVLIWLNSGDELIHWQFGLLTLTALLVASTFLNERAQNLDQVPVPFALLLIFTVADGAWIDLRHQTANLGGEDVSAIAPYFPWAAFATAALIANFLLAAVWRTGRSQRPNYWLWLAAGFPVFALPTLWATWHDISLLGDTGWLFLGLLMTAVQSGMALLLYRQKKTLPLGADVFSASAIILLLVVSFEVFEATRLTFAIGLLALAAAFLEARYAFPNVARLLVALVALVMFRLVVMPGIHVAMNASWPDFALHYAAAGLTLAAGLWVARKYKSDGTSLVYETAGFATVAIFLSIAASKFIAANDPVQDILTTGLIAFVWGVLSLVQKKRMEIADNFIRIRRYLSWGYGGISLVATAMNLTSQNPLFSGEIQGPMVFDSLAIAYVLPAALLLAYLKINPKENILTARYVYPTASLLLAFYATLEIRRFWSGDALHTGTIPREELYTYTVAMLVLTLAVFTLSILRKHTRLRTIALAFSALTALKVFLWDMSGLEGLGRATAFIGLGLTLAGIGWLHQRFRLDETNEPTKEPSES